MPKPLKIAVDVRDLRLAKTGTRTYLLELCTEFKKLESADIRFYFLDTVIPVYNGSNKLLKLIEHVRYQFWKQVSLPIKAFFKGCHIVFCTDNFVPLIHLGFKTIPVFHDAFFFETPENYGRLWLWLYKKTAIPAAKRAACVVTPSAWAKKQINKYTQISNDKLIVISEGPKAMPAEDSTESMTSIDSKSYLLHVGSLFKRKNIPALISAFNKVKASDNTNLKLFLVGMPPSSNTENDEPAIIAAMENSAFKDDIIMSGYMPDQALALTYKNALMYVFPSINEGFGIPVLEAFSYDLPVLVANNTCLPEVGGNAVLQFDPFDVDDIASKIKMVLTDETLQQSMIEKGRERLKLFSWRSTAQQLIKLFKKAV